MSKACDFPDNMNEWTKDHVKHWVVDQLKLEQKCGEILYNEDVTGVVLVELTKADLKEMGLKAGPASLIVHKRNEFSKSQKQDKKQESVTAIQQTNSETNKLESLLSSPTSDLDNKLNHSNKTESQVNKPKHTESTEKSSLKSSKKKSKRKNIENQTQSGISLSKHEGATEIHCDVGNSTTSDETETKGQQNPQDTLDTQLSTATTPRKGQQFKNTAKQPKQTCQPHPFDESHTGRRYVQNCILPPETGPSNLMDPIHEFKLLNLTENATEEDIKKKFGNEVFRFAAACMNTRTNGTIHFGVGDTKCGYEHGEIIGVSVDSKDKYIDYLHNNFVNYFDRDDIMDAKNIIRPPHFVEILNANQTLSGKYVIEVDVLPSYNTCGLKLYHIHMMNQIDNKWMKSKEKHLFIRDGSSSRDILGNKNVTEREAEYRRFLTRRFQPWRRSGKLKKKKQTKNKRDIS